MKRLFRLSMLLALSVALIVPLSVGLADGSLGNPGVLPPNSHPYGKTYVEWSLQWSRWAYSIPFATNPVINDLTGAYCGNGQSGPVWFLAGTFNPGAITRSCTIPPGKAIFFPIINVNNDYPCPDPNFKPGPGQSMEDFLTNGYGDIPGAKDYIDPVTAADLKVEVDGTSLQNLLSYRKTSSLYYFTGDISLKDTWDPCVTGTEQPAVQDGYWIMLAPLSAGKHTLHLYGNNGIWAPDVTYNLTIK